MGLAGDVRLQQESFRDELSTRSILFAPQTVSRWIGGIIAAVWLWSAFLRSGGNHAGWWLVATIIATEAVCWIAWVGLARTIGASCSHQSALRRSAWCFSALFAFLLFYPEYFVGHTPPLFRSYALIACVALLFAGLLVFELRQNSRPSWLSSEASIRRFVVIVVLVYFLVTTAIALWKLHVLAYIGLDLSYFSQCFYTTLHGQFFHGNVIQDRLYAQSVRSDFAAHNSPVMLLVLPFYYLYPSPATLLVLRNACMSLSAWPAYKLARYWLSSGIAAVVAIAFLFLPTIFYQSVFDFALLSVATPLLLWALNYYFRGNFGRFALFGFFALCVREDVVFVLAGLAFVALVERRKKVWVISSAAMAGTWAVLTWKVTVPFFLHGAPPMVESCFAHLGSSPPDMIRTIVTSPQTALLNWNNLIYLKQVLTPFAGIMVAGSAVSLLATPYLAINLLASSGMCFTTGLIYFHYSLLPIIALFAGALVTLNRVSVALGRRGLCQQRVQVAGALLMLSLSLASLAFVAEKEDFDKLRPQAWQEEAKAVAKLIPADAAVAAPRYLLPMLANRPTLYELHRVPDYHGARPEYVIFDLEWNRMNAPDKYRARYVEMLETFRSSQFPIVYSSHNYIVFSVPAGVHLSQTLTEAGATCNE
jgi:uncharacterized membrane protein